MQNFLMSCQPLISNIKSKGITLKIFLTFKGALNLSFKEGITL